MTFLYQYVVMYSTILYSILYVCTNKTKYIFLNYHFTDTIFLLKEKWGNSFPLFVFMPTLRQQLNQVQLDQEKLPQEQLYSGAELLLLSVVLLLVVLLLLRLRAPVMKETSSIVKLHFSNPKFLKLIPKRLIYCTAEYPAL